MTTVATWAAILVSIGTPALTLVGVLLAQLIVRRGATELEARSRREEVMRNLRWAAELAVSDDDRKARLGTAQLRTLSGSAMRDDDQQRFIDAAMAVVVRGLDASVSDRRPRPRGVSSTPMHGEDGNE